MKSFCVTQVSCLRVDPREGGGLILVFREFKNLEGFLVTVKVISIQDPN